MLRTLDTAVGGDDLTDPGVWSITCFVVRVGSRRMGVAQKLLDGAVDSRPAQAVHTRSRATRSTSMRKATVSSSELYHGTSSMFVGRRLHRGGTPRERRDQ